MPQIALVKPRKKFLFIHTILSEYLLADLFIHYYVPGTMLDTGREKWIEHGLHLRGSQIRVGDEHIPTIKTK